MANEHSISSFIIDHNNQYIVAHKPAGMPIVSDHSGDPDLKSLLQAYAKHDIHILTRIDRPVSGICLFAKSQNAARILSDQIRNGIVKKSYLAVVENPPNPESGTLTHFLKKGRNNKALIVDEETKDSKKSTLEYTSLVQLNNYTALEVKLLTGRFHQIRSQLAHIGSPIKGDVKYGARRKNKDRSIHLHAYKLQFEHPVTKQENLYQRMPNSEDTIWQVVQENLQ